MSGATALMARFLYFSEIFHMGGSAVKIAVCIKRMPDMESRFRIARGRRSRRRDRPQVRHRRLRRLRRRSRAAAQREDGAGETVVFAVGPDVVQETLRKAMSMGADRAVQLKADSVPVRRARHRQGARRGAQGRRLRLDPVREDALDTSDGVVGTDDGRAARTCRASPRSRSSSIADGKGTARRELEGAQEIVEFPLPAVVTIDEGLNARALSVAQGNHGGEEEAARSEAGAARRRAASRSRKLELPPERPAGRIIGEGAAAVPELVQAAPDRGEGALMANIFVFAETRGGDAAKGRARGGHRGAAARRRNRR